MISPDCVDRNQNDIGLRFASRRSGGNQRMRQQERQTSQEMGNSSQWCWAFALLRLRYSRFAQLVLGLVVFSGRGQRLGEGDMAARIIRIEFDCPVQFG